MTTGQEHPDWVSLHSECEVGRNCFDAIAAAAEHDVERFNALPNERRRPDGATYRTSDGSPAARAQLWVHCMPSNDYEESRARVVLTLENSGEVTIERWNHSGQETGTFSVAAVVDAEGACRFRIGEGDYLEAWQISRVALEPLFFPKRR